MTNLYIDDKVANYREKFKTSSNKRIRTLNKKDIKELIKLQKEIDLDIFEAAPEHGFDGMNIGIGSIKIKYRAPIPFRNVHTGEMGMTSHTPIFVFKPSAELQSRTKRTLNEVKKREEEIEGEDTNG